MFLLLFACAVAGRLVVDRQGFPGLRFSASRGPRASAVNKLSGLSGVESSGRIFVKLLWCSFSIFHTSTRSFI